ncbi:uncharacterized protein LOC123879624 isoform X2 [Maniola jurtina]|uniref:uncharacterized protein LOC123879624 isoform X2 n=1 Tax=Maniola jurtina TaxID=191418 RepID=UPI001E68D574|nr:uncharacterized protein LOC123879624 isoform X2 [Maniola jurtina]
MTSKKAKNYCGVFGCLNNDSNKPDLSFFNIPTEQETRLQWLRSIDREDLFDEPTRRILVCEVHFKAEDISVNSRRKLLKKNCSPCLHLPKNKEDKVNNTPVNTTTTATTQTDIPTCCVSCETQKISTSENITQTTTSLSADTPRKRKLKSDLSSLKKRLNFHEIGYIYPHIERFILLTSHSLQKKTSSMVETDPAR